MREARRVRMEGLEARIVEIDKVVEVCTQVSRMIGRLQPRVSIHVSQQRQRNTE